MLKQRVLTAIVLVPPGLAAVWLLSNQAFAVLMAVIFLLGAWEWTALMQLQGQLKRGLYVLLAAAVMCLLYIRRSDAGMLGMVLVMALAWWSIALIWVIRYPAGLPEMKSRIMLKTGIGLLLLGPAFIAMVVLHGRADAGPLWILFLLVLIWAADTGAYFSGRSFGRHKMAVRVSPGKTWEGAVGGFALSAVVAACAGIWIFHLQGRALALFVLMCLAVIAFSIVGDLTESMFKRHVGVKDSGAIMPGHGGVLDRFDSLMAAAPLFLCGLTALGM